MDWTHPPFVTARWLDDAVAWVTSIASGPVNIIVWSPLNNCYVALTRTADGANYWLCEQ